MTGRTCAYTLTTQRELLLQHSPAQYDGIWAWQLNLGPLPDLIQEIPKVLTLCSSFIFKATLQREGAQWSNTDKAGVRNWKLF